MRRRNIEFQMVVSALLIVAAVLGCSLAAFLAVLNRDSEGRVGAELAAGREGVRLAVAERKHRAELIAGLLAANGDIRRGLIEGDAVGLSKILSGYMGGLGTGVLSVLDADGVIAAQMEADPVSGAARARAGEPVFLNPLFEKAVMGLSPSGVELCMPDVICVIAYVPVSGSAGGGRFVGFVRAGFALDDEFAAEVKRTTGTDYILIRRSRAVASSLPSENLPGDEVRRIEDAITAFSDSPESGGGPQWLELGGAPFALEAETLEDASGRELALNVRGRDTSDIAKARREGIRYIAMIALAALVLAAGFSAFTARKIFDPLRSLMETVREITGGRLDAKISHAGNDEIGDLAAAFNEMSSALAERERNLRDAAEEIRVNQDQLIRSGRLAAIGELAAGVAHEIGNPLSAISGYAQLLRSGENSDGRVADYAGEIEREAEFIERIIQDLLEFSRPAREDEAEPLNLREIFDAAVRTASSHKAFSRVKIEQKFAPDIPPVKCGKKEIIQVFINLLVNAAQAMPAGGAIFVTGELKPDRIEVRVRDEGEGIPKELRGRIFDPFFTTKPIGVGTGLGLSICYRIIEKYGGGMKLEDTERGACFMFTLPI